MFRKKKIDEWAWDYWLLQQYAKFCFHIFYRKIEVINRQNIPKNQPVILAPNHQNALMDAMVLVCNTSYQNIFLARADIFKGKRLIRFLTYLNIMPIYRIRDGIENVKKNDVVFEKTLQVLHNKNNPLILFPEGNHGNRRRLRQLVKGLFRIAFQAQEKYGNQKGVKIVPVGVDYGHYQNFRTTLFVNIGKPIEVSQFMEAYHENPVMAINQMKDRFGESLSKQMIDIQTEEYYDLYMYLRKIFNREMRQKLGISDGSLSGKFRADKVMIDGLNRELETKPESIRELDVLVKEYQSGLKKAGLRDWILGKGKESFPELVVASVLKAAFFPVFLFGFINNYLPYQFIKKKTQRIKDPQFVSSFRYVLGMIVFPVWYLITGCILAFTPLPFWSVLLYVLLVPVTGLFAYHYYVRVKKFLGRWRFFLNRNSGEIMDLASIRKNIFNRIQVIMSRQIAANEIPG